MTPAPPYAKSLDRLACQVVRRSPDVHGRLPRLSLQLEVTAGAVRRLDGRDADEGFIAQLERDLYWRFVRQSGRYRRDDPFP